MYFLLYLFLNIFTEQFLLCLFTEHFYFTFFAEHFLLSCLYVWVCYIHHSIYDRCFTLRWHYQFYFYLFFVNNVPSLYLAINCLYPLLFFRWRKQHWSTVLKRCQNFNCSICTIHIYVCFENKWELTCFFIFFNCPQSWFDEPRKHAMVNKILIV